MDLIGSNQFRAVPIGSGGARESTAHSEPITGTVSVVIHDMDATPIESPPITQTSTPPNPPRNNDDNSPTSPTTMEQFSQCEPTCSRCLHQGHEAYDCDNGQPTELAETTPLSSDIIECQNSQEATTSQDGSQNESFHTAEDELPGSSPNHPIVIEDDRCNTPLKVSGECEVCKWTRQAECNHYELMPAWLRELRQKFGQRMRRLAIQEALFPSQ